MNTSSHHGTDAKTVLIIDDELGILEVLEFILSDAGYRVMSAQDGQQALERLQEQVPDVVILDYMMPIVNGPAFLKTMRLDEKYAGIPVILMSALPEQNAEQGCAGCAAYLRKPFKSEALLAALAICVNPDGPRNLED